MIYQQILNKRSVGRKQLALLIDPDKTGVEDIREFAGQIKTAQPDLILVGGSLVSENTDEIINELKSKVDIPVILFPGSIFQISSFADGILFLSLLSGRNPEFLISHHVAAAPLIRSSGMEVLSTGYILVDGGKVSSVEYMSNTKPVPAGKTDLAVATALAGEMMGMKTIYLEAGSGASEPVPSEMISKVKENLSVPLVVGGGLNSSKKLMDVLNAGADIVVAGNAFEKEPGLLQEFADIVKRYPGK